MYGCFSTLKTLSVFEFSSGKYKISVTVSWKILNNSKVMAETKGINNNEVGESDSFS